MIIKSQITQKYQKTALFGYIGLLLFMPLWLFILVPDSSYSAYFTLIVYILPLVLPLRGFLKDNTYTYAWANFIVMIYFIHGLCILWISPSERLYALLELMFASCMFIGCTYYAKHRGQELGLKIRRLKDELKDEKDAHHD
jgi:uncharacterized membrane protein